MKKTLPLLLVGLLGLGIGFLAFSGAGDSGDGLAGTGNRGALEPGGTELVAVGRSEDAEPERAPVGAVVPDLEDEPAAGVEPPEFEPYTTTALKGTITLIDEHGNGPFLEDGSFFLYLWDRGETSYHEVTVERGEWETDLPSGVRLSLGEVELGERPTIFLAPEGQPIEIPLSGFLELDAQWPAATRLRVRARDTGAELNEVTLVHGRGRTVIGTHPGHFGAESHLLKSVPSPIELPLVPGARMDEGVSYFARAPGYSWNRIHLACGDGRTHDLYLDPSGSLSVELSEFDPITFPSFRLWRLSPGGQWENSVLYERALEWEREFEIEGLPAGDFRATVDIGGIWNRVSRLASEDVKIFPGLEASVSLQLAEGPQYDRATLAGTVIVPREWDLPGFRLHLRLTSDTVSERDGTRMQSGIELSAVEGRDDAWTFRFEKLVVGTWRVGVSPTMFATFVELPREGVQDCVIEVPKPAVANVRCIDRHTREDIEVESLQWRSSPSYTNQRRQAEPAGRPGRFTFRAPVGEVSLVARGEGIRHDVERFELLEGENELVLELRRAAGIVLALRAGGRPLEWPADLDADAVHTENEDWGWYTYSVNDGKLTLYVSEPGSYRVEVETLEGYDPVPAFDVLVAPASFTEHEISLHPASD